MVHDPSRVPRTCVRELGLLVSCCWSNALGRHADLFVRRSYIETTRDIRRLMSTAKSPIFSGFGETLAGIVTIRAFAAESRFQGRLFKMVDAFGKQDWGFW